MRNASLERPIRGDVIGEEIANEPLGHDNDYKGRLKVLRSFADTGHDKVKKLYKMRFWKLVHPLEEDFVR